MADLGGAKDRGADPDRIVDLLLGEVPAVEASQVADEIARDPAVAAEAAQLEALFSGLRELTVEPTRQVGFQVGNLVARRARLRRPAPSVRPVLRLIDALKVASIAAVVVGGVLLGERFAHQRRQLFGSSGSSAESLFASVPAPVPVVSADGPAELMPELAQRPRYLVQDERERAMHPYQLFRMEPNVVERYAPRRAHLDETRPQDVWLLATNAVASMRQDFSNRLSPQLRRQAIRASGGSSFLAARIEALADDIAARVDASFANSSVRIEDAALALRALMAGGSTRRLGDHAAQVRRCTDWLLERLPSLDGGELATALSGLVEVAVVSGPRISDIVGEHASRLAESIIYTKNSHRPSMLNWQTTAAQLADAGQVLRLAPAFGTVNKEALLARSYLATHLSERLALSTVERPDLLAAQLYGFGDLIERAPTERKLSLWHAEDLVPEHYVALHHVAWSRFPLRLGWADFERELRRVSIVDTPVSTSDASALLLALAVSYAAPGASDLQALALR